MTMRASTAVVIGGGASGVIAAAQLAEIPGMDRISIVERGPELGRGIAYGTRSDSHILNTRAGVMSSLRSDEGQFLYWAKQFVPGADAESYLPRRRYADYLGEVLSGLVSGTRTRVEVMGGDAIGLIGQPGSPAVLLDDGTEIGADLVVLAVGHGAPATLPELRPLLNREDLYVPDPWVPGALDRVAGSDSVLLVGSGLTAIDVLLSLDERGHVGSVTTVSRHGLLPTAHREPRPAPLPVELDASSARAAARSLRAQVRVAQRDGGDWRGVIDGLRHTADRFWSRLPRAEQAVFLRMLLRFWEVHRHRMAPSVAAAVNAHRESGRLEVVATRRLTLGDHDRRSARVGFGAGPARRFGAVINCTGPTSPLRLPSPLLAGLLEAGLLEPDPLGLGVVTDDRACAVAGGSATEWLRVVGPLRRSASYWETTAVPDIREHAAVIAASIN